MENKQNFTSVYANVSDALLKLEKLLQEEITKEPYRKNENAIIKYKRNIVYPVLKLQGVAKETFRNKYEMFEELKLIEETEKQRNKVMNLLRQLEEKPLAPKNTNRVPNWKPRRTSFLTTMKNKFGRLRSRSFGGKRTTRKH